MNVPYSFTDYIYKEYELKEIPVGYYMLYLYNFSFLILLVLFYKLFMNIFSRIIKLKENIDNTNKIFLELLDILKNVHVSYDKETENIFKLDELNKNKNKIIKIIDMINHNNEENKNINSQIEVDEIKDKELYDSLIDDKSPTYVVGTLTDVFE